MNNLINALNNINAFMQSVSISIVAYGGTITGMVSRLVNFASVSDNYIYFAVQFIPAPLWSVFLFEFTLGLVKFIVSGVKQTKILVKWW
jgi:hypothetical protein